MATSGTSTIGVRKGKGMHHRDDCLDTRPRWNLFFFSFLFLLTARGQGRGPIARFNVRMLDAALAGLEDLALVNSTLRSEYRWSKSRSQLAAIYRRML